MKNPVLNWTSLVMLQEFLRNIQFSPIIRLGNITLFRAESWPNLYNGSIPNFGEYFDMVSLFRKKFEIRLLFGAKYNVKAGVIICFE